MKCIHCGHSETKVIDSRVNEDGTSIRRRRECMLDSCKKRFTTYETVERTPIMVKKTNDNRQRFDKMKIKQGILKACEKRPVSTDVIDKIVDEIEKEISNQMLTEIESKKIGEYVMDKLKDVDEVAYVRFASVHRQFKDLETLIAEISKIKDIDDIIHNLKNKK